jgi:diguanylate cyclase (GGDEF)-like protein/PAS domain S-box-containing protein
MSKARILVVEDESLVAKSIYNMLTGLGYEVPAIVSSAQEAIRKAKDTHPDLVLMDIMLKGTMDGVGAATEIRNKFGIPVVYMSAFADESTLKRAKITQPFGYVLKPFEERDLYTAVEIALYKHAIDKERMEKERWLSTVLTNIADGVISTDAEGRINFMNTTAEQLTGRDIVSNLGCGLEEVFMISSDKSAPPLRDVFAKIREGTLRDQDTRSFFLWRGHQKVPIEFHTTLIRDDRGHLDGSVIVFRDITDRLINEKRLEFLAIHDPLTDLPNRTLFDDRLNLALSNARRRNHMLAVFMLDLDYFKKVNDSYGHAAGDELLKHVGGRLSRGIRETDTVARLGGDEFMVLLSEVTHPRFAHTVAARLLKAVQKAFILDSREIAVTVSIGIAVYPADGLDAETLKKKADLAMYEAKEAGRNTIRIAKTEPPGLST